ncbi:MAG: SDR family NAD(P)-dependent oxidoreductase [Mycobacterium sp.]
MADIAVVTGAASGMGLLAAERLTAAGWQVVAVDLPGERLDGLAGRPGITLQPCDVADHAQVDSAAGVILRQFGHVDRLVNAAGIAVSGRIEDVPAQRFAQVMNVNYLGTVHWVQTLLPGMRARNCGELVLFASLAGWMPTPTMAAYTATKFAVLAFAETLAMELHRTGISVRCVCPPAVQTPMLDDIFAQGIPDGLGKLSRPLTAAKVLDAVDASLRRRRRAIYVFPDLSSKVAWRVRRFTPVSLGAVLQRLVGTAD